MHKDEREENEGARSIAAEDIVKCTTVSYRIVSADARWTDEDEDEGGWEEGKGKGRPGKEHLRRRIADCVGG